MFLKILSLFYTLNRSLYNSKLKIKLEKQKNNFDNVITKI